MIYVSPHHIPMPALDVMSMEMSPFWIQVPFPEKKMPERERFRDVTCCSSGQLSRGLLWFTCARCHTNGNFTILGPQSSIVEANTCNQCKPLNMQTPHSPSHGSSHQSHYLCLMLRKWTHFHFASSYLPCCRELLNVRHLGWWTIPNSCGEVATATSEPF